MFNLVADELEKRYSALTFARLFEAYLHLTDSHQEAVRRMIDIVTDQGTDVEERERALDAITDALSPPTFPSPGTPAESPDLAKIRAEMDRDKA